MLDPATNQCVIPQDAPCDSSQLSSSIGGKFLRRQCTASMTFWPNGISGSGNASDLAKALGGSWPTYSYAGYSPTFSIDSGYYLSLKFVPTSPGAIQLSANQSYGDGGTISLSTIPGALTARQPGAICVLNRGGSNSLYVSTVAGTACQVTIGTTYYVNFADVDSIGTPLCFNGKPNTCSSSTVSYTLYTSK